MRKWAVPLTVASIGGLGVLFLATRGRETLNRLLSYMESAPDAIREFNDTAEREIARLQTAVDELADSLGTRSEGLSAH